MRIVCCMVLTFVVVFAINAAHAEPEKKPSIPDVVALKKAAKLIEDVYRDQFANAKTAEQESQLAIKLLRAGTETQGDVAGRYALLVKSQEVAVDAGDVGTAMAAAEAIADSYSADRLSLMADTLTKLAKSGRVERLGQLAERINSVIDETVKSDRYDIARRLCSLSVTQAKKAADPTRIKDTEERTREVEQIEQTYADVKKAMQKLGSDSNDAEAYLIVGRFRCLMKGDWEGGLPLLARGSDPAQSALAKAELVNSSKPEEQIQLADGWWNQSDGTVGVAQRQLRAHAAKWYAEAAPRLSGLAKAKAEKRLAQAPPLAEGKREKLDRSVLSHAEFLDWINGTWKNDIRSKFRFSNLDHAVRVSIGDGGGYEEKLILFSNINARRQKLIASFTPEEGTVCYGFRPLGLAPRSLSAIVGPNAKTMHRIEIWIGDDGPHCTLDGVDTTLDGNPDNIGIPYISIRRSGAIVFHELQTVSQ